MEPGNKTINICHIERYDCSSVDGLRLLDILQIMRDIARYAERKKLLGFPPKYDAFSVVGVT